MILADASVWIDQLRGTTTPETLKLRELLIGGDIAIGDLTLTEVLQGFDRQDAFDKALRLTSSLPIIDLAGVDVAIRAARNFRYLRARGITVRGTIDTLLATCCIMQDHALLFSDRDFHPFVEHLGLRSALDL